ARVASISLVGADSQSDLQHIPLRTGDTITEDKVRAGIQALYDTGRYSQVEVDASPAPDGGINLAFRVTSNFYFGTIRLEPPKLLERTISGYARLPYGEKFRRSAVTQIVQSAVELLKAEGYFEATIVPDYAFDETTRLASVTLRAQPGVKATIGNVR